MYTAPHLVDVLEEGTRDVTGNGSFIQLTSIAAP